MMAWTVFLVLLLIFISYLILRKFYDEHKIKIGRRNLAGKVVKWIFIFVCIDQNVHKKNEYYFTHFIAHHYV